MSFMIKTYHFLNTNFMDRKFWMAAAMMLGGLTQVSAQTEQRQLTVDVKHLCPDDSKQFISSLQCA